MEIFINDFEKTIGKIRLCIRPDRRCEIWFNEKEDDESVKVLNKEDLNLFITNLIEIHKRM